MTDQTDTGPHIPPRPPTWRPDGSRIWLYPDRRQGRYAKRRLKWAISLMIVYLALPFLSWDGRPLLRFDINERVVYTFGQVFQFNDGPYILFILLTLALLFFLVTALKGRFWCSYACPQTVFLEWLIRPIEELIEGNATKRKKADRNRKGIDRAVRKGLKYFLFLAIASAISHTFLLYFFAPETLFSWIFANPWQHKGPFLAATIMTGLLFFDFVYFREQFCSVLCPYMRFQTVLMDADTPVIAYDTKRGEPRQGKDLEQGDCIDCDLCIKVCPTGIDIRNGLQLECIQCGRCADACDSIMRKIDKPEGLVRTASMREIAGTPNRGFRLRPIVYGGALTIVISALALTLASRDQVSMTFLRQTGAPFSVLPDGRITNTFQLRLQNNSSEVRPVSLVTEDADVSLICAGCSEELKPFEQRLATLIINLKPDYPLSLVRFTSQPIEKHYELPVILPGHQAEKETLR